VDGRAMGKASFVGKSASMGGAMSNLAQLAHLSIGMCVHISTAARLVATGWAIASWVVVGGVGGKTWVGDIGEGE